ncbi:hypothetical protein [Rubrivivax gelatinosus]|uniref:Replicative helicase inhibitor G39P N-terminal domain-containing protein n=1 Tax=Rubrivivax gelatinosus TaxID=28068 RepID=A0A4R2MJI6_RUBGE|nr:hypothetical protein [Rubrivivax gelatinosus]MBK1688896.1 hypothetical protein [Rubrivivax gelatinosus]TCP03066.1 hypothetical protein EV684_105232 [Rubrivivax gelatinosus]
MRNADFEEFTTRLRAMFALLSHGRYAPDADACGLWFKVLEPYPMPAVVAGFNAHVRSPETGRTLPIPGDIVAKIEGIVARADSRPSPEEAWAIALQARDEALTVIWTDEIAQAWDAARRVLELGDEVGARMAFREVYGRLLEAARAERSPARWQASIGTDKALAADALRRAAASGRQLDGAAPAEVLALPAPRAPIPLLTTPVDEAGPVPPEKLAALQAIRERLVRRIAAPAASSADAQAKRRTAQLRDRARRAAASYATNLDESIQ